MILHSHYPSWRGPGRRRCLLWWDLCFTPQRWVVGIEWKRQTDGSGRYSRCYRIHVSLACFDLGILLLFGPPPSPAKVDPNALRSFSEIMGYRRPEESDR